MSTGHGGSGLGPGKYRDGARSRRSACRQDVPVGPVHSTARAQANGTTTRGHAGKPTDPKMSSQFLAYDENYKGGVALSTGWVAGAEGGAKSIVTGQVGGRQGKGVVDGSRLDGQPAIYRDNPNHHEQDIKYGEIASFVPFPGAKPGVTVPATSSTEYGADLLVVGGMTPGGQEVRKYTMERPDPDVKTVAPKQIANLPVILGVVFCWTPLAGR